MYMCPSATATGAVGCSSCMPMSSITSFGLESRNAINLLTSRVMVALSNTFLTSRLRSIRNVR